MTGNYYKVPRKTRYLCVDELYLSRAYLLICTMDGAQNETNVCKVSTVLIVVLEYHTTIACVFVLVFSTSTAFKQEIPATRSSGPLRFFVRRRDKSEAPTSRLPGSPPRSRCSPQHYPPQKQTTFSKLSIEGGMQSLCAPRETAQEHKSSITCLPACASEVHLTEFFFFFLRGSPD